MTRRITLTALAFLALAPVAQATSPTANVARLGTDACTATMQPGLPRRTCYALQRLDSAGYTCVFQQALVEAATWPYVARTGKRLRDAYGAAEYNLFRAYVAGNFTNGAEPFPLMTGPYRFYDDNAWVGITLVTAYSHTHAAYLLQAARGIMQFIYTGLWRKSDPWKQHHHPGGIYHNQSRHERNTGTQARAIRLAILLYRITHAKSYLNFAKHDYWWTRTTLGKADGDYHHFLGPWGHVSPGNDYFQAEATMAWDGRALGYITHDAKYMTQAKRTETVAANEWTLHHLEHLRPEYVAMYFRSAEGFLWPDIAPYVQYEQGLVNLDTGILAEGKYQYPKFPVVGGTGSLNLRRQQGAQAGLVSLEALVKWRKH